MERVKLTAEQAERIINLLRNNPGVSMTLADINDELGTDVDELAAHLDELVDHGHVVRETTGDGFDVFRFPHDRQNGSMAPPL